jgi:hypothetical protein
MAGLGAFTGALGSSVNWYAAVSQTGGEYTPISNSNTIGKKYSLTNATANNLTGGCDEVFSFQQAIAAGGSAIFDLFNLTNVLLQAGVAIVRIKGYQLRLLSVADDSTISTPPASAVTVTNQNVSVPNQLDFNIGGSGLTLQLTTSGGVVSTVVIGTAGSGYLPSATFVVTPSQTGSQGCVVAVQTNSSGVPTTITLLAGGSGYTNGAVPATVLGQYVINNGGVHLYFDPLPTGFAAVSSVARNLRVTNNDAVNTATVELTVFGCTT